jgi:hypothetical protein
VDEHASQPEPMAPGPPSPFVVPPPSPADVPPTRRTVVTRQVRKGVAAALVVVAGVAVIGHIGRGDVAATDLDPGMCIRMPQGTFKAAHREDCTKPHDAEIIGLVDHVMTIPVLEGTASDADRACRDRFESYTGNAFDGSTYTLGLFGKKADLTSGIADVTCYVRANAGQLSHSLAKPAT